MRIYIPRDCLRLKRGIHAGGALPRGAEPYTGMFFYLETRSEEIATGGYVDAQGRSIQGSYTQIYDHAAQILHLTGYQRWREGEKKHMQITRTALRYTFPQELAGLLHAHGFAIARQYGDWNYEPLTEASPSIIVVCRPRASA